MHGPCLLLGPVAVMAATQSPRSRADDVLAELVAGGGLGDVRLSPESRQAVNTQGESAIATVLQHTFLPADSW